jgi:adenylate kinase
MIPGARIVLLGRQGSGKGTQCTRLSRHFVVPHISTGDMLRAAVREGTELGRVAKEIIDAGGLVGDDIMVGIPRTVSQAESLDRIAGDKPLHVAIDLEVPRAMVLDRLSLRRVCRDCGTNYQSTGSDPRPWLCDTCGGDVVQRDDDTPEAINRRLDLYESQTQPLIEFYGRTRRLERVDGVGSPDEVFARLTATIEKRR